MADIKFVDGLYYKEPHEKAPDFLKGKLSIHKEKLSAWLDEQEANEKGYINLDIKVAKSGNPYISVDEWKPRNEETQQEQEQPVPNNADQPLIDDQPF